MRAIAPGIRSRAWQLALGWPVGLVLEILAFSLTAAIGVRDGFLAYPVIVGIPAALVLLRRRPPPPAAQGALPSLFTRGSRWALWGLCLLAFAYLAVAYYTITPLPGTAPGVVYPGDMTFHIALAASALHGWPPGNWMVAGQPMHYHYFVNLHMAAISQVTGIHLPLIVFRLYNVPLTALLVLQLGLAGRLLAGRSWAGPVTVALFLLIREFDLTISDPFPFGGIGMFHLWGSPSQLLGMVLFVPALVILALLLDPALDDRAAPYLRTRRRELWVVLAVLLIGAGGAKSVILPMFAVGLILYLAWTRLRSGRVDRTAITALGLCVVLLAVYYVVLYHGGSHGLRIYPPATIREMPPLERLHDVWPGGTLADVAYWLVAIPAGTVMYFAAPLLGLALWLRGRRLSALEPAAALSICLLIVGVAAFFFLYDEYLEQTYFTLFGLIAVMPYAAAGLMRFADQHISAPGIDWRRSLLPFSAAWLLAMVFLALLADRLAVQGHYIRADALVYVPVAVAIGALVLLARRFRGRLGAVVAASSVLAVLLTAALDAPLDVIPQPIRNLDHGAPLYTKSRAGLRPRELQGMEWIRDHVDEDALLAVSNDRTPHSFRLGPTDGSFPAFTEHRTFREAWSYTARANEIGQRDVAAGRKDPFPRRTALERAVFDHGDRRALRIMVQEYGVTHLVISKKDGAVSPLVYRLGRLVYSNGALDVIQLPVNALRAKR